MLWYQAVESNAHLVEPQLEWVMPAQLGTAIASAHARDTLWLPG